MKPLIFSSLMKIRDGNPYVDISKDRVQEIKANWRKPLPVLIRINGKPDKAWKINMMPQGNGGFYLYLHGDVRKASNTKVGDKVEVEIVFDQKYKSGPMHPMPSWFNTALNHNPTAKKNWDKLIPSRQKEILRYFSWLKTPETKERNLQRAMRVLSGKPARFMARSWDKGE